MSTEREFGREIARTLDSGLALPAEISARLEAARARAVAAQQTVEPSLALEVVDGITWGLAGPSRWLTHVLLPAALLIAGVIGVQTWRESQQNAAAAAEAAELDARLLKGDLPIDAYLDNGFQAWLKRSSE